MCEVCGIVSASLKPESSYWKKMCEYVTDTKKEAFQKNGCTISAKRDFYIKDIAGHKCFAAVDGNVENYDRIRQSLELRGVVFEGVTAAELALLSYFAFGKGAFKIFHGAFSVVIWDGCEKELVLARDKIGFNQFFYYYDGQRIVFASRIKSLLKFPFVKKDFCDDIYCKLFTLAGSRLSFETLFDKIYEVPPSNIVVYKDKKLTIENYFTFGFDTAADSFKQTIGGFKYLLKKESLPAPAIEKVITEDEIFDRLNRFVEKTDMPSPYINLNDLSNLESDESFVNFTSVFNIPERFKLPMKGCDAGDKEFINDFLSTLPPFSYEDEKDISKKEAIYIKLSIVLPQVISAKKAVYKNILFPFLDESVVEYSLKSLKYEEKLLKNCLKKPKEKPIRENIRTLKSLFYKKITETDFMLGFIEKEELLRFTRLFPRPETMLYLLQADIWLNKFL